MNHAEFKIERAAQPMSQRVRAAKGTPRDSVYFDMKTNDDQVRPRQAGESTAVTGLP